MIDLRSDTLTRPTAAMREAMLAADVGDDVYGEDPSVSALEQQAADLLQKPAALFCASGTQSNLVALLAHCQRGDEYIVGQSAHTYRFEGGGAAVLGSIQPQPLPVQTDATLALDDIEAHIKPDDVHFARTRLVCLENTHNGQALRLPYMQQVAQLCRQHQLALHLDGARLFNACLDQDYTAATVAAPFDSISICLSKGLGAPVGSVLVGSNALIESARRWRKMLGGGMRQAGMLAAAGSYALHQHIDRLAQDHAHAAQVKQALVQRFSPTHIVHHTNMLHLNLDQPTYQRLKQYLQDAGIRVNRPRWVFHLDISDADTLHIANAVQNFPAA